MKCSGVRFEVKRAGTHLDLETHARDVVAAVDHPAVGKHAADQSQGRVVEHHDAIDRSHPRPVRQLEVRLRKSSGFTVSSRWTAMAIAATAMNTNTSGARTRWVTVRSHASGALGA